MKRGNNSDVGDWFIAGSALKSKTMRSEGNALFSFNELIGLHLEDGGFLLLHQEECRSSTTSAHVNLVAGKLVGQRKRYAHARLNTWRKWGLRPHEAVGVSGSYPDWSSIEVESERLGRTVYVNTVRAGAGAGLIQVHPSVSNRGPDNKTYRCTWISLEKPKSLAHVLYSIAPHEVKTLLDYGTTIYRHGRMFVVPGIQATPTDSAGIQRIVNSHGTLRRDRELLTVVDPYGHLVSHGDMPLLHDESFDDEDELFQNLTELVPWQ